jgi:exosortase
MNETPDNKPQQDWRQDTVDCWHRLPNKTFFFALLAAWLALFQFLGNSILGYIHTPSLFQWMYGAYNNPNPDIAESHGNFIPFLVAGLFWWKRKELLALPLKMWWPGILILAAAMSLHILAYVVQQPRFSVVALFMGIYGLMGLAWGREWLRHSSFPFFFFAFSIPLAGLADYITFPLQQLVSFLTEKTAHLIGIGVIRVGTQLFDASGTYGFDVQAPCSGIRSLIAIFLLATIYAFMSFRSPWRRIFLMALAFPFAVLGNLLRMMFIIVAAEMGGQSWGIYVHEGGPLGIISIVPYAPAIIGLIIVGRLMEKSDEKKHA